MGALPLPPLPAIGEFQFGVILEADGDNLTLYVALAHADVTVFAVAMNVTEDTVSVALLAAHHFGSLPRDLPPALSVALFRTTTPSIESPICVALAYSAAPACTIVVDERCGNTSFRSTCVANATNASVLSSSIAAVELSSGRVYVLLYSMPLTTQSFQRHELTGKLSDGGAHSQAASVYGAVLSPSAVDYERWWVEGDAWSARIGADADEPLYLYLGDNPSVSLLPITSGSDNIGNSVLASVAFLLTDDSGYCPNSEINNKRADQGVCDILPSTCDGSSIMNYAYGSVQALQLLLLEKKQLSPCHPSIVSR